MKKNLKNTIFSVSNGVLDSSNTKPQSAGTHHQNCINNGFSTAC